MVRRESPANASDNLELCPKCQKNVMNPDVFCRVYASWLIKTRKTARELQLDQSNLFAVPRSQDRTGLSVFTPQMHELTLNY